MICVVRIFFTILFLTTSSFASTILFIGDSQSAGPFGKKLDELLRQQNQVMSRAVSGSVGGWWDKGHISKKNYQWNWGKNLDGTEVKGFQQTPILSTLVAQTKPDFVIMEFGGNYVGWDQQKLCADVERMIETATKTGAKCLFVSGPDTFKNRELLPETIEKLKDAAEKCLFIDSTLITKYPDEAAQGTTPERNFKADGRHYNFLPEGEPLAIDWAQKVYDVFVYFQFLNSLSSD